MVGGGRGNYLRAGWWKLFDRDTSDARLTGRREPSEDMWATDRKSGKWLIGDTPDGSIICGCIGGTVA